MAQRRLFLCLILILVVAVSVMTLLGCADTTKETGIEIKSMTVVTSHEGPYILDANGHIQNMNLSDITFRVVYTNGDEEIIEVNDTMFSVEDIKKFEEKGDHTIFINYGKSSTPLTISVRSYNEVNAFTATFMSKGGSIIRNQETNVIVGFETPVRENYTFDGWYTNFDGIGDRVIAPYTLSADTTFFAKWIDNRRCNVTFKDGEVKLYEFVVVYGTSIDLNDKTSYPDPDPKEGKIFKGWEVEVGQTHEITADLVLRAVYESEKCLINLAGEEKFVDYGTQIVFDKIPTAKVGHQGRWVAYINNSESFVELTDSSLTYDEDTKTITVDRTKIEIKAEYQINNYEIRVFNGLQSQNITNIKSGNIILEQTYANGGGKHLKEYNTTFNLAITDGRNDVVATAYEGYDVVWCFVTLDSANKEIWRREDNRIWDNDKGEFVLDTENGDEISRNYLLKNAQGDVLARIRDGNITEIQGNITIKPKYTKRIYTITLSRRNAEIRDSEDKVINFKVPYYTDFALYNPNLNEYNNNYATWNEVKDSYLEYTVASWLIPEMVNDETWQTAKWDIAWYNHPSSMTPENKVTFEYNEQTKAYGYYTIMEDTVLYAKDIDNRTYDIIIRYGYNFNTNTYTKEAKYTDYGRGQAIEKPADLTNSITYDGVVYTYNNLYDYPYQGPNTKKIADPIVNIDSRTKNMVYYAHYANVSTYIVKVFDKTQSEAYAQRPDYLKYAVLDNSILYKVQSGTIFTSNENFFIDNESAYNMLYKGSPSKTAQTHYLNNKFVKDFYDITKVQYQQYLNDYGGGNKQAATQYIQAEINNIQAIINEYLAFLNILSAYTYEKINLGDLSYQEYYNKFFTNGEGCYDMNKIYGEKDDRGNYTYYSNAYDSYRREIFDWQQKLELINNYADSELKAETYENEISYPYADSIDHLNTIYDEGVTDYYFAGWYYDSFYTQKADDIATDPDNPMHFTAKVTKDLILYAKWVDKKKGSEGLIFERVEANKVVVVNFLNEAQAGTTYNGQNYSRNLNDQGNMPKDLGTRVSVQIPSEHQFRLPDGTIEICSVVGIVAGAFDTNASIITDFALPNSIRFIEEGSFKNCILQAISYQTGETNYLYVDADIAVYQVISYTELNGIVLTNGKVLGSYNQGNLITYANASVVNTEYFIPDKINEIPIIRVASYAFRSTKALTRVNIGENVIEIGDYAFMGCNKLSEVILPNSLQSIGINAFKDCGLLATFSFEASAMYPVSQLRQIKRDAFLNTSWLINQNGLVIIDNILLGVQVRGDGAGYEVDGEGNPLVNEFGENYIIGREGEDIIYTVYVDSRTATISRIVINKAITVITDYAFNGITSLVSLDINATDLIAIDDYAFNNCNGLSAIYFRGASSAITLGESILAKTSANISFVFPKNYMTVQNMLVGERWLALYNKIDMMEIEEGAFSTLTHYHKPSGTTVTIPTFATVIADGVFSSGFATISQVIIPNTITKIGANAFANMTNVSSIEIPQSVIEIGLGAFYNCTRMMQMTLPFIGGTATTNGYLGYIFGTAETTSQNQVNYVPASLIKIVLSSNPSYKNIADYAMYELDIATIELTDKIITIGKYAFYGNTNLKTIHFNQYIETVDNYAFYGCTSLASLDFHANSNLATFGDYAFYGCTLLNTLNFNPKAKTIGNYTFANCTQLRSVYFKQLLQSIGNSAFEGCIALGTVNFVSGGALTSIGQYAFRNCSAIISMSINAEVTTIGLGAFEGCAKLSSITLNFVGANLNGTGATHFGYIFGATTYQDNASKVPASLKTVKIQANSGGQSINIADYAFYNLASLTSINLSSATIGTEGAHAFDGCSAVITR